MKNCLIIILSTILFLSCKSQDWTVEDKLYSCLSIEYADHGIDLGTYLDTLENYLIKENVLINSDGNGKINYYRKITTTGEVPYVDHTHAMRKLLEFYPGDRFINDCFYNAQNLDTTQLTNTHYYKISEKVKANVAEQGETTPITVSKAILSNFKETDFEHPFYRAQMLLTYVLISDKNRAYIRHLPKKIETKESSGGFLIELPEKELVLVNGKKLQIEELKTTLLNYLQEFDESTFIRLSVDPKANYPHFSEILSIIDSAYQKLWDQISIKENNNAFNKLDEMTQNKIIERFPRRVIESVK